MSINEKLSLMLQEKSDIRQSIVNKGVNMSGADFLDFSEKIDEIIQGGGGITTEEVVLWTNPNPTTSVSSLTIDIPNMSQYDMVKIICRQSETYDSKVRYIERIMSIKEFINGNTSQNTCDVAYAYWATNYYYFVRRMNLTESGINVKECVRTIYTTSYSNSKQNAQLIPYQVYGIKGNIPIDADIPTTNGKEVEIGKLNGTKVYCQYVSGSLAKENDLVITTGLLIACGGKYTRASLNDTFHIGFINGDESNFSQMVYVDGTNSNIKLRNKGTTSYFNPISFELYVIYSK